jgi:ABC-2 type transport system ATP-binding protein
MICERVIIIHEGRIVAQNRIEDLSTALKGGKRIRLRIQGPADRITDCLAQIDGIRAVSYEEPHHTVEFPSDQEPQARMTETIVQNGWTLLAMESVEMSLEDIFLKLTSRGGAGR